jgi:hypothetical protein
MNSSCRCYVVGIRASWDQFVLDSPLEGPDSNHQARCELRRSVSESFERKASLTGRRLSALADAEFLPRVEGHLAQHSVSDEMVRGLVVHIMTVPFVVGKALLLECLLLGLPFHGAFGPIYFGGLRFVVLCKFFRPHPREFVPALAGEGPFEPVETGRSRHQPLPCEMEVLYRSSTFSWRDQRFESASLQRGVSHQWADTVTDDLADREHWG